MYEATNLPTRRRQNQQQNGLGVTQPSKNTDPHTNTQQKNKQTQKSFFFYSSSGMHVARFLFRALDLGRIEIDTTPPIVFLPESALKTDTFRVFCFVFKIVFRAGQRYPAPSATCSNPSAFK
jgi:hypothetical protein